MLEFYKQAPDGLSVADTSRAGHLSRADRMPVAGIDRVLPVLPVEHADMIQRQRPSAGQAQPHELVGQRFTRRCIQLRKHSAVRKQFGDIQ
jgi:hypothetical protein